MITINVFGAFKQHKEIPKPNIDNTCNIGYKLFKNGTFQLTAKRSSGTKITFKSKDDVFMYKFFEDCFEQLARSEDYKINWLDTCPFCISKNIKPGTTKGDPWST